jgi:adenosine kinase
VAVLVSGSVAVDHIMVFQGRFKDVILPDRVHALNVAFHVPELRRTFGGCAANIAYDLRLLGDDPLVLATVRRGLRVRRLARPLRHPSRLDRALAGEHGRRLSTDLDDNQIVGFRQVRWSAPTRCASRTWRALQLAFLSPNGRARWSKRPGAEGARRQVVDRPGAADPRARTS